MSGERALNFDQRQIFLGNDEPIIVSLWFVYKIIVNNYLSRFFVEFVQTQKKYPTSLDKISFLT